MLIQYYLLKRPYLFRFMHTDSVSVLAPLSAKPSPTTQPDRFVLTAGYLLTEFEWYDREADQDMKGGLTEYGHRAHGRGSVL